LWGCGIPWALPKAAIRAAPLGRKTQNLKPQNPANTGEEPKEFRSPERAAQGEPEGNTPFCRKVLAGLFQVKVAPEFESRIFTFGAGRLAPRKTISRPYPNRLVLLSFPSFATYFPDLDFG
jgi:hypothetical protein